MRIDAHVHYIPPTAAQTPAEPYWELLLASTAGQSRATANQMVADMERAGLDAVVVLGEYYQQPANCAARNRQVTELVRRYPGRVLAMAVVQPKAGPAAIDEVKRCREAGMVGVGELNPYAQGFRLDDPDFLRLAEACIELNLPLNLHAGEEVGPYYPGKSTTPLRHYYHLAQRYPELKLILAHWGGGLIFYESMPRVRRRLKNVWYDTAASPLLYATPQIFPAALTCAAPHKILYGSDYPLRLYPRRQPEPDFAPFVREIEGLHLPAATTAAILGDNAARLFGLIETAAAPAPPSIPPPPPPPGKIEGGMAVARVAAAWPQPQPGFEKYGLPWHDSSAPHWEPIEQAAAARGWDKSARQQLLDNLNDQISDDTEDENES
jgi:predicted TIM-barrel fold metal-dependent hydrolase